MIKWLLTLGLVLLVTGLLAPWLGKYGLGRLPGDIQIRGKRGVYRFPIASSLILSALLGIFVLMI